MGNIMNIFFIVMTVSINHTSSEMCDLNQLTVAAFVMEVLAPHIAFSVQCDIFKYICRSFARQDIVLHPRLEHNDAIRYFTEDAN